MHPTRVVKVKYLGAVLKIQERTKERPAELDWQRTYEDPSGPDFLEHLGGVEWWKAPRPPRRHRCRPQTRGLMAGAWVQRCACGAINLDNAGPWMERNTRTIQRGAALMIEERDRCSRVDPTLERDIQEMREVVQQCWDAGFLIGWLYGSATLLGWRIRRSLIQHGWIGATHV